MGEATNIDEGIRLAAGSSSTRFNVRDGRAACAHIMTWTYEAALAQQLATSSAIALVRAGDGIQKAGRGFPRVATPLIAPNSEH
jgi:hypothetical protein